MPVDAMEFLRAQDRDQIAELGISVDEVQRQIRLFERPPAPPQLIRPCTVGDGIRQLTTEELAADIAGYEEAAHQGRLLKFVPASGAATRMFQTLLARRNQGGAVRREETAGLAAKGDKAARELLVFMDGIRRFAFFEELAAAMARDHLDVAALVERGEFSEVLEYLLTARGLDYAALPKGLLKFHRYTDYSRTPFEEHLVEGAAYARSESGLCRLHFTVSPEHAPHFRALLDAVRGEYEQRLPARFEVSFSAQKPSTNTLAVDSENRPFRTRDGRLLFRPGGHGALIENLNDLRGDIIFIKNIDNVVPDQLKPKTITWKKAIAGYLVKLQRTIFDYLSRLAESGVPVALLDAAADFAHRDLGVAVPAADDRRRAQRLIELLNRPIRVCGMVRNTGEPGGGPFWVRSSDGRTTTQIIESAQVDPDSPEQQAIFRSSTHFNAVDLVCGVRDWRGEPFDLRQFVDPNLVFIAHKSQDGRTVKALELPGLWNGAMAYWTTVFVEVPLETSTPVKTISDLLRAEHQPE